MVWDLSDLYTSPTDPAFLNDLETITDRCIAFRSQWSGRIATASEADVATMVDEYATLLEVLNRLIAFTHLVWTTDTEHAEYGRLLQSVRETTAKAWKWLVFVNVEAAALPVERLEALRTAPSLARIGHWFERMAEVKPHMLSEELEQVLSETSLTSRQAWVRLHDELVASQTYTLNGKEYSEASILKLLYEPDRELRRTAAASVSAGLRATQRTQAYIFNTVIADHALNGRLRHYPTWLSERNVDNEVSDAAVDALIRSVTDRYDIVQRFYRLKKRLLGLDEMFDYDRYAPVASDQTFWSWDEARELVVASYADFHPEAGAIAEMFFERSWIHAPVRKGKKGGAFSASTVPSAHPYVFMNFAGSSRDVQVLAHELGHGIHQYLSRQHGVLLADTPLTVAETASVFGEMLVFRRLLDRTTDRASRLALLVSKIDDTVATVFRQISLNRFEAAMHETRATDGELSADRFCDLWMETQQRVFGDTVTLTPDYRSWWSYISHFMHVPGYVYAYAFGELLVLALHERYLQDPSSFPEHYMTLLGSGGSRKPEDLLAPLGIDINDPQFWNAGLQSIERLIDEAESLID